MKSKIKVNHVTGTVSAAPPNAVPSVGDRISILEIEGAPSLQAAVRGVRESAILYSSLSSPTLPFSRLGLGKIIR